MPIFIEEKVVFINKIIKKPQQTSIKLSTVKKATQFINFIWLHVSYMKMKSKKQVNILKREFLHFNVKLQQI